MAKRKVLITGAAGRIGRVLRDGLKDRCDLRLLYNRTVLPARGGDDGKAEADQQVFPRDPHGQPSTT